MTSSRTRSASPPLAYGPSAFSSSASAVARRRVVSSPGTRGPCSSVSTRALRCSPRQSRRCQVGGSICASDASKIPSPTESFDLVVSALAVHHLDGPAKADLFARVAERLRPGGRFVLGDVIVPVDPADAVTPIDPTYDRPSSTAEQLTWLAACGLDARIGWQHRVTSAAADTRQHCSITRRGSSTSLTGSSWGSSVV